ncbi:MAG: diguanylate cyclase [Azonexus sp.]|jgi:diguanylate cyclase (GGDEF)-like protein
MTDPVRILVVDDSRLARMALASKLRGTYQVHEESDGESAWQKLLVDPSISAVISDLQMPRLDGAGLVQRVRASKQPRLQGMPIIVVSGDEGEAERERVRQLGASDFVTKGSGTSEILSRLNNLLALVAARETLEAGRQSMVQDPASGLFTRKYLEHQAVQALSHATRSGVDLCIMVLGFDAFDQVRARLGPDLAERVSTRFAKMLAGKMRTEDSLGHFGPGQFAIVAPGTSLPLFTAFAQRVREAVEVAHVPVQGQPVRLTVSIGVASVPSDEADTALALLELAGQRMLEGMGSGGNRIVAGAGAGGPAALRQIKVQRALELIVAQRSDLVRTQLGQLGIELLPLLHLMNQDLGLNLPMADIERRLRDRTSNKK